MRRLWQALTMRTVDIREAESNLDHLIEEAEHGKPFTISVDGKPLLKVARIEKEELEKLPKVEE
jgi:prevent-host-death family protein